MAQVAAAVFGNNSVMFFAVQVFTALILAMAANTAFNGFPILASILARTATCRGNCPRGDRLVFCNGILILAGIAGLLICVFEGQPPG